MVAVRGVGRGIQLRATSLLDVDDEDDDAEIDVIAEVAGGAGEERSSSADWSTQLCHARDAGSSRLSVSS